LGSLRKLTRVRFSVIGPGGKVFEWAVLQDTGGSGP
jgi:hypothetical protein